MSYSISKEALVPLLTKCIIRHGTLQAIGEYPSTVSKKGGDATVTEEFIALNEIRAYTDSDEMIRAAFERAIIAYKGALDKADKEVNDLTNNLQKVTSQRCPKDHFFPYWKYLLLWCGVIGIGAWMDEENFSATLAASVVIAGTFLLCFFAFMSNADQKQLTSNNK